MILTFASGCGSNNKASSESNSQEREDLQDNAPESDTDSNIEEEKFDLSTTEGQAKNAMKTLEIWDGSIADSYAGGDGSEYDPYQISNGAQLAKLRADSDESGGFEDTYFVLTSDIVLNDLSNWNFTDLRSNFGAQWTQNWNVWDGIGVTAYFEGVLDGGGHTIYGLYKNGLFSNLEGNISNVKISCSLLDSLISKHGGIAGYCRYYTTIDNCHIEESIIIGNYSSCVGGICGQMDSVFSPISNCSMDGIILSSYSMQGYLAVGGIVGDAASSNIDNCVNSARIEISKETESSYPPAIYAGGICGITSAVVNGCKNTGDVDLKYNNACESVSPFNSAGITAGGIAGYLNVGPSGVVGCNNEGQVTYEGNVEGAITTKTGEIDTSEYFDFILCNGGGYSIVAKQVEKVTDVIEYVGVLDKELNWIIPLSDDTLMNQNGKLSRNWTNYQDYTNRCKAIADYMAYAGSDVFIYGQARHANNLGEIWYDSVRIGLNPPVDSGNPKIFHVSERKWVDIEPEFISSQPIHFTDGYFVAANNDSSTISWDRGKYVLIINSETGVQETSIYCKSHKYIGQYSEGVFFSYDGFYNIDGKRVVDLSEYAGLIMNQPYFENGRCKLIAYNENGTKYIGEIDIGGNFISEFTAVN